MRLFWKTILNLFGWKTDIEFPSPGLRKFIIIVGPHTSNWDFMVLLAYRSIARIPGTRFLGKKELFDSPIGFVFRWLGGTPVDRKSSNNVVDQVADIFNAHEKFAIALSPEGTRKKVDKLKTGFYFIAKAARVPIIMVGIDYPNKRILFSDLLYPSDDQVKDFETILNFYRPIKGKNPENGMGHL